MKEVVEIIAKALVDKPEEVVVSETLEGEDTIIELSVAQDDVGKVIGKSGKIAKAIRSLLKAAASKAGKRVTVVIN